MTKILYLANLNMVHLVAWLSVVSRLWPVFNLEKLTRNAILQTNNVHVDNLINLSSNFTN